VTQPTRDQLRIRFRAALDAAERAAMALVFLDLDGRLAGVRADKEQVVMARDAAEERVREPRAQLAAIDAEIGQAVADRDRWQALLSDDTPRDRRAVARFHHAEAEADITRLSKRRDFAAAGFEPLFDEVARLEAVVRFAESGEASLLRAMGDPFGDEMAQATEAYKEFRAPLLGYLLLRGDESHPEWPQALQQLAEWCKCSGHLPPEKDPRPRVREVMADGLADAMSDPAPSMTDIIAQTTAEMTNNALQKSPSRIDDYRYGPVWDVPGRPELDIPHLRDYR
jgi:hypothetical protein